MSRNVPLLIAKGDFTMKFQNYKQRLGFLVAIAILFTFTISFAFAQEGATFSGRIIDERGNPAVGISITIRPYMIKAGGVREEQFMPQLVHRTGLQGSFSITDIPPISVKLVIGDDDTRTKTLSIEIGDLILYPNSRPPFEEMRFSLAPGSETKNVVIKVKTEVKPQIRARVVSADGTPITEAPIHIRVLRTDIDESGGGSSGMFRHTDAEGYFVEDLRVDDEHQYYRLGIEYQGYLAKSVPFILHEGQPEVHLLLRLNENPIPEDEWARERLFNALDEFLNPTSVWVVNPTNGHAYKEIYCHSIEHAIAKATEENAYLVSINDKAENEWIKNIFGRSNFWIGLSDAAEEGKWVWHSGEPVTYTNWVDRERSTGNTDMKDYVIIEDFSGKWVVVAPGDGQTRFLQKAILERTDIPVETSSENE